MPTLTRHGSVLAQSRPDAYSPAMPTKHVNIVICLIAPDSDVCAQPRALKIPYHGELLQTGYLAMISFFCEKKKKKEEEEEKENSGISW